MKVYNAYKFFFFSFLVDSSLQLCCIMKVITVLEMMNKCLQIALFIWDKEVHGQNANAESFQLWENTSTLELLNAPMLVEPCCIFKKTLKFTNTCKNDKTITMFYRKILLTNIVIIRTVQFCWKKKVIFERFKQIPTF